MEGEKKKAKAAAEAIKAASEAVPSIFSIDLQTVTDNLLAVSVLDNSADSTTELSEKVQSLPVVIRGLQAISDCCTQPRVQMVLSTWAGSYKKQCKETGRAQKNVVAADSNAKASLQEMWKTIVGTAHSDCAVDPAATNATLNSLLNVEWLYGYEPEHHNIGHMPNGLDMWKLLQAGEVLNMMVSICDLVAAMKMVKGTDASIKMTCLKDEFKNLTAERLSALQVRAYHHKQHPGDLLFVPPGWLHAELCVSGVLLYGLRKSVLLQAPEAGSNYESLIECMAADGAQVDNYKLALPFMKTDDDDD